MVPARGAILLIDDDPFLLKVLADAFREAGFSVFTAGSGAEGIRAFLEKRPAVVVCDLIMPGMGGVTTCQEIRRRAEGEEPITILLTSMFKEPPHEHETADMGARFHIPKSMHPVNIVILVEQLLDRLEYPHPVSS